MGSHPLYLTRRPTLRLVQDLPRRGAVGRTARPDVARENLEAAGLRVEDVRTAFAADVSRALDGGRAAILAPERRRRLVGAAVARGLRAFDANLVIAIVQDAAREGDSLGASRVTGRLSLVREGDGERRGWPLVMMGAVGVLAGALLIALIAWATP